MDRQFNKKKFGNLVLLWKYKSESIFQRTIKRNGDGQVGRGDLSGKEKIRD